MKKNICKYLLILMFVVFGLYCIDTSNKNHIKKMKSEIYFNAWFNELRLRAETHRLFFIRSLEGGWPIDRAYKIFNNSVHLNEIDAAIYYGHENKILNIVLDLPYPKNKTIRDIPKETAKKICEDALQGIAMFSEFVFKVNGEYFRDFDKFIDKSRCSFYMEEIGIPDEKEIGWIFDNKTGTMGEM